MRLRFTEPASFELEQSISYFIDQAPASAADFADSIDAAVARLLDFPYSAQEADMPRHPSGLYSTFSVQHFYTVEGDEIVILHIRHAARRWPWE